MRTHVPALALAAMLAAPAFGGGTRIFHDRDAWVAALGGATMSIENFDAVPAQTMADGVPTAMGLLTVTMLNTTNGRGEIYTGDGAGTVNGSNWFQGFTGLEPSTRWTFDLSDPFNAYGADYLSPASGSGIVLVAGGEVFDLRGIGGGRGFFGFISDAPFTVVEYRRDPAGEIPAEIWSMDDVCWANAVVCRADFDNSGDVTVQDIFDYLTAWFASAPPADLDGSGSVTLQDLFDFIGLFFAGCA